MFQRFAEWLALTKTEQNIILFLSVAFMVGITVKLFKPSKSTSDSYNYSRSDSIFTALSSVPDDSLKELRTTKRTKQFEVGGININTATQEELESLPGIGATLARRIIEYRETSGSIRNVEELHNVKGISKKKLEKLKPYIRVQ
ncbi:MAG: helix-hairpin-helix domain-containing protein [Bacteroidetes bacterium]|nr:helix-hairpin-helix domain-containing protein [Bacteroidota bacterium]